MRTQLHDRIQIWLTSEVDRYAPTLWPSWDQHSVAAWMKFKPQIQLKEWPGVTVVKKVWEKPILSFARELGPARCEGFADLAVLIQCPRVREYHEYSKGWDVEVFCDEQWLFFEVKPKIESLGELIRQLRRYEVYTRGRWVVVSPDAQYATLLREQGFEFLSAPGLQGDLNFAQ